MTWVQFRPGPEKFKAPFNAVALLGYVKHFPGAWNVVVAQQNQAERRRGRKSVSLWCTFCPFFLPPSSRSARTTFQARMNYVPNRFCACLSKLGSQWSNGQHIGWLSWGNRVRNQPRSPSMRQCVHTCRSWRNVFYADMGHCMGLDEYRCSKTWSTRSVLVSNKCQLGSLGRCQ